MSDAREKAQQAYDKAYAALEAVIDDADSTDAQVEKAQQAFDIALVALHDAIDGSIAARTQALSGLGAALQAVITEIRKNPVGDALDQLNDAVAAANAALGPGDSNT